MQKLRDRDRRRRLAGAADSEIAEANHRHAGALATRSHAQARHRAIERRKWREQNSRAGPPPKVRLAVDHGMIL
jgi:hypothetical protein